MNAIVYPLPTGDIIETYRGNAWIVVCGHRAGTTDLINKPLDKTLTKAIGPFVGERSLAQTWLQRHCPLGMPEEDGTTRNRCADGLLWAEHQILPLEGWG